MKTSSYKIYAYFILAISHIANNICVHSFSTTEQTKDHIYIIEVMELFTIISCTQIHVYVQRKTFQLQTHKQQNLNKTRYCERLMHHCLFDVFWLQSLFFYRLWHTRYSMVRGHICMLQRNRDIYYYCHDYYFRYNEQLKLISCKLKISEMNF